MRFLESMTELTKGGRLEGTDTLLFSSPLLLYSEASGRKEFTPHPALSPAIPAARAVGEGH